MRLMGPTYLLFYDRSEEIKIKAGENGFLFSRK